MWCVDTLEPPEVEDWKDVNEDIVCVLHRKLVPEKRQRRLVFRAAWYKITSMYPGSSEFAGNAEACSECAEERGRVKDSEKMVRFARHAGGGGGRGAVAVVSLGVAGQGTAVR